MSDDLKPCPFCGGEAEFSLGKTGDGKDWHYVECSECEAMGPRVQYADHNIDVKGALADTWNRRAHGALAALPEVVAMIRAERERCAQIGGDAAVAILLRNEPDATPFKQQCARQGIANPIRKGGP